MKNNKDDAEYERIQKRLKVVRKKISEMANKVTMEFNDETVDFTITNRWKRISKSVIAIECALNDECCTVINMKFKEGGVLNRHKHSRQEEIFVVSGEIHDFVNDIKTKQGNVYIIPPYKEHGIKSDRANLTIVFRPPFPKIRASDVESS